MRLYIHVSEINHAQKKLLAKRGKEGLESAMLVAFSSKGVCKAFELNSNFVAFQQVKRKEKKK